MLALDATVVADDLSAAMHAAFVVDYFSEAIHAISLADDGSAAKHAIFVVDDCVAAMNAMIACQPNVGPKRNASKAQAPKALTLIGKCRGYEVGSLSSPIFL